MATLIKANVVKANLKVRQFILSFMLGIAVFSWLGIYFSHHLQPMHSASMHLLSALGHGLLLMAVLIDLGLLVFGIWIGQTGIRALKQGCYPPSNSMVMCDTLLVTGWQAVMKAIAALMLAIASLLGTLGIGIEIVELLKL